MDQNIEIKILKQQIRDLKNKLFEATLVQPRDRIDNLEYPEETEGSKAARANRIICNKLTDEEREIYYNQALDMIYEKCPQDDPRKQNEN